MADRSIQAPVITFDRLRMLSDGDGITTLVVFHGCPLRCRYCLNPFSFAPETRRSLMTAGELYEKVRLDELYFLATGGGVTFGGGEPLLQAAFLEQFRRLCGPDWHLCAETSLNVPRQLVTLAAQCMNHFYVDCKDLNPEIYRAYTGADNDQLLSNLEYLLSVVGPERITLRVPLIPGYNTPEDREKTVAQLKEMGVTQFDLFTYRTKQKGESL